MLESSIALNNFEINLNIKALRSSIYGFLEQKIAELIILLTYILQGIGHAASPNIPFSYAKPT